MFSFTPEYYRFDFAMCISYDAFKSKKGAMRRNYLIEAIDLKQNPIY